MKTNRFLVVAGISLALALTISCSSDDDDNGGGGALKACITDDPGEIKQPGSFCIQTEVEFPKDKCNDTNNKLQELCPSNPAPGKECPMKIEGYDVKVFMYGYVNSMSCEEFEGRFKE